MHFAYSYFFRDNDIYITEIEGYIIVSFVLLKEVVLTDVANNNSCSTCLSEATGM
jgi:hypothetical protein